MKPPKKTKSERDPLTSGTATGRPKPSDGAHGSSEQPLKIGRMIEQRSISIRPTVLIIGRPNVGKSTLFNHWVGHRLAIESKIAGTTRDFIEHQVTIDDHEINLIDTAGLEKATTDKLLQLALIKTAKLIESADLILFLVSAIDGIHPLDQQIADIIRKSKKPAILIAAKADNSKRQEIAQADFWNLGLGEPLPISAKQNVGINKLEEKIASSLNPTTSHNFVFLHGFYRTDRVKDPLNWLNKKLPHPDNFWQKLPHPDKPDLKEQMDFVMENADINPNTTIITHSLGGILALKMIEENNLKIKRLILIAPPLRAQETKGGPREELQKFGDGEFNFSKIKKLVGEITIFQDKNDHVILDEDPAKIAEELDGTLITLEPEATHFNQNECTELLNEILPHHPIRFALVGRPNVGKSTLLNQLIGRERSIVSDIPGTTRDLIEIPIERDGQKYVIIDTAGLRRPGRRRDSLEFYSADRSQKAIDHADVIGLVIDSHEGMTKLDLNLAQQVIDAGRALFFIVNKWDLLDTVQREFFQKNLARSLKPIASAPIITISALTGQRVGNILSAVDNLYSQLHIEIKTSRLNNLFKDEKDILFLAQKGTNPPRFEASVRDTKAPHYSVRRRLENRLRTEFDLAGIPIRWNWKLRTSWQDRKKR